MAAIGKEQHGYVPNEWIVRRYLSLHWGAGAIPRKETWQRHEKAQRQLQQLGVIDATGAYKAPLQKSTHPSQLKLQQLGVINATGAYKAPLQKKHNHHSTSCNN